MKRLRLLIVAALVAGAGRKESTMRSVGIVVTAMCAAALIGCGAGKGEQGGPGSATF